MGRDKEEAQREVRRRPETTTARRPEDRQDYSGSKRIPSRFRCEDRRRSMSVRKKGRACAGAEEGASRKRIYEDIFLELLALEVPEEVREFEGHKAQHIGRSHGVRWRFGRRTGRPEAGRARRVEKSRESTA